MTLYATTIHCTSEAVNDMCSQRFNGIDKKELYTTALSRSTRLEYIRLENKEVRVVCCDKVNKDPEQVSVGRSEYQHGNVYKVVFNDESVYIGSTCRTIEKQLANHASARRLYK